MSTTTSMDRIEVTLALMANGNIIHLGRAEMTLAGMNTNLRASFEAIDRAAGHFRYPVVVASPHTEPKGYKYVYRDH
jgi:hypothetical protein